MMEHHDGTNRTHTHYNITNYLLSNTSNIHQRMNIKIKMKALTLTLLTCSSNVKINNHITYHLRSVCWCNTIYWERNGTRTCTSIRPRIGRRVPGCWLMARCTVRQPAHSWRCPIAFLNTRPSLLDGNWLGSIRGWIRNTEYVVNFR
jgi:hypothetical protein